MEGADMTAAAAAAAEAEANGVDSMKSEDDHFEDMNPQHVDGAIPRQTRHLSQSGGRMHLRRMNQADVLRTIPAH